MSMPQGGSVIDTFKNVDIRIAKLDIRDHIQNARNIVLANFEQSASRDEILSELNRINKISDDL